MIVMAFGAQVLNNWVSGPSGGEKIRRGLPRRPSIKMATQIFLDRLTFLFDQGVILTKAAADTSKS